MGLRARLRTVLRHTSQPLIRFRRSADGATAIEYSLVASLLAITCIAAIRGFGTSMDKMYAVIVTAMTNTP